MAKTESKGFNEIWEILNKIYEEAKINGFEYALATDVILYKPARDEKNNKPVISFECKINGEFKKYAISGELAITEICSTYNPEERTMKVPVASKSTKNFKIDEETNTIWIYS